MNCSIFFDRLVSGEITMKGLLKQIPLLVVSTAFLGSIAVAQRQAPQPVTNVLLVHGAFADSSSWKKVIPILKAKGLHVVTVDIPLTSLAEDVAVTREAISLQTGSVLLVGHSYGGTVITEAGDDPKIAGLVYIAAYAPGEGQTTGELGSAFPTTPGRAEIQPLPGGMLHLTQKGVAEDFAPDMPASEQSSVFASQIPLAATSFKVKLSTAAWTTKPSWYIVATNDRIINPDLERSMAKRMNAETTELQSSHVVMLSHPDETAAVIIQAAAGK
jgi:pimeloyl-ACP methyl ester carboxylesterase